MRPHRAGINAGIEWVLLAVDNMTVVTPGKKNPTQLSMEPGWQMAANIVGDMPLLRNALERTLAMDPKQRDSIALTMRKAVMPWMRLALRGNSASGFRGVVPRRPDRDPVCAGALAKALLPGPPLPCSSTW